MMLDVQVAKSMKIRCVVSDLDGTLLSPDHTVPVSVLQKISQFNREGRLFTLATGRPLLTAQSIIRQIGIQQVPVILCNGAVIVQGGQVIERHPLQASLLSDLAMEASVKGINVLFFREDRVEVFERNAEIAEFEQKESVRCSIVGKDSLTWRTGMLDKVILLGEIGKLRGLWGKWNESLDAEAAAFQSEPNYIELVSKHASKGAALLRLAELIGMPVEQMMAIGNQMNDLPMLEAAGIGAAVANSPEELKQAADYVCEASYGYGVIEAIDLFT